jgi:hypothetical protein
MPNTDQWWSGDTPQPDGELFIGATEFKDLAAVATLASAGAGLLTLNLAAAGAGNFFANLSAMLKRTGVLATPAIQQAQFGTAASQPGPSGVVGTSDPEGIRGYPPFLTSKLPTLVGPQTGAVPKGFQINSVDVLYTVGGSTATLAQIGLTNTNFVNNVAPNVVNVIVLGANGLPTAVQAQPYRFNVPVAVPGFPILPDTETILNIKLTGGGTIVFYGCVLKSSYNFQ